MKTHLEHGELHGYTTCGHKTVPKGLPEGTVPSGVPSVLWTEHQEVTCKVCRGSKWWSHMQDASKRVAQRELEVQRTLEYALSW